MNIAPKQIIFSLLATALTFNSYADATPTPPPPPTPVPSGFPIDGNIVLLVLAGTIYGMYILKKFKFQTK
jgi:hypothetical protein